MCKGGSRRKWGDSGADNGPTLFRSMDKNIPSGEFYVRPDQSRIFHMYCQDRKSKIKY